MKHRKYVLPILIATALVTPTAFAQVLGGGINVGGGLGAQAGSIGVGAGMQTRGDAGVRTDAVRTTTRRLRGAAARADAEARGSVAAGLSAASQVPTDEAMDVAAAGQLSGGVAVDSQSGHATGGVATQAAAAVAASASGQVAQRADAAVSAGATTLGHAAGHAQHAGHAVGQAAGALSASGSVEGSAAGSAHAADPASLAAEQATAAVSGNATAAAHSALTAQSVSQGGDHGAGSDKAKAGRAESKAERKRGRQTP